MSQHTITLIPGDGIAPEVTDATVAILEAAGRHTGTTFTWERYDAGADSVREDRRVHPESALRVGRAHQGSRLKGR